jgi:hypothetical protein
MYEVSTLLRARVTPGIIQKYTDDFEFKIVTSVLRCCIKSSHAKPTIPSSLAQSQLTL